MALLLAGDTHKFESRYLDGLLGGAYPEHKATYIERSPIHHTDQLSCPILVLQGDEDKVVPPNQSAAIVQAAADKGLPHAYVLFEGEQHGFRQTDNVIRALQLELWFYGRVLGFNLFLASGNEPNRVWVKPGTRILSQLTSLIA